MPITPRMLELMKQKDAIIEFLNEVEEQDWELDKEDITHILRMDFDFVRKQYEIHSSQRGKKE